MSSKQTSTTKSSPWKPAQASLENTLNAADDWQTNYQDRPLFQGSSVAGFDPSQSAALTGIEQRAQAGSPLVDQSKDYVSRVLGGEFLEEGNPHFARLSEAITRSVMPGVNATFMGAGRTGSDAHGYSLTKALGDTMAPIAFQNYQAERGMMDQAARFAPQLADHDYYDLDRQFAAGATRQGQAQSELSDEIARYYQEQYRPYTAAQEASNLTVPIAGLGGTSSTTQKSGMNPLTAVLGGGMMAMGAMSGNPMAAMGGANMMFGSPQMMGGGMGATPYVPPTYTPAPAMIPGMYGY